MLTKYTKDRYKNIVFAQIVLTSLMSIACVWRFIAVWIAMHQPVPHTIAARYLVIRMEQLNVYFCLGAVMLMLLINRMINIWLAEHEEYNG